MTAILTQNISYIPGFTQLGATPARMELFEDRVVVTTLDDNGAAIQVVIDTPLSELKISGSLALLRIIVGDVKRTIDFSFKARAMMATPGGILGVGSVIRDSGIYGWINEFRSRGVTVKYISIGHTWLMGLAGFAVFAFVVFVIATNMSA
jgi:hypothetical protein